MFEGLGICFVWDETGKAIHVEDAEALKEKFKEIWKTGLREQRQMRRK